MNVPVQKFLDQQIPALLRTRVFFSPFTNIYTNQALEEWLFRNAELTQPLLMLWINDPAVVTGRYQNQWIECSPAALKKQGILLARRNSGGGTVFHDRGNLNLTLFTSRNAYDKRSLTGFIKTILDSYGIISETGESRADIYIQGRKISGSAFKLIADRAYHHSTLLIDCDLEQLAGALHPAAREITSKGTESIRSKTVNLREVNLEISLLSIVRRAAVLFSGEEEIGNSVEESAITVLANQNPGIVLPDQLESLRQRFCSDTWIHDNGPDFEQVTSPCPLTHTAFAISVKKGVVQRAATSTGTTEDVKTRAVIDRIEAYLTGRRYAAAPDTYVLIESGFSMEESCQLFEWLKKEIGI